MILVTGGTGMLGRSLQSRIPDAKYIGSKDCNLLNENEVREYMDCNPDVDLVIHLAALVGGIQDNAKRPYDYFTQNIKINTNIIDCSVQKGIKVVAISSSCSYPQTSEIYPFTEDMVHLGAPEDTNMSYGYAKRMMLIQLQSAFRQYGLPFVVLYASNLYGPHDCFDTEKSHLVASLIRKFHFAKTSGDDSVELLGTGKSLRQFTYVHDVSDCIVKIIENNCCGDFNIASPFNLTIKEIAHIAQDVVGYKGKIIFNGKLDGQYRKDVSCSKLLSAIGDYKFTTLQKGIEDTYKWYKHYVWR